ncbi:MAG: ATP-grasp domain-containing protein [Candidatus Poseidoniales archaeon]|jgi:ribosomal protein S6--L-glutamate ligase
MRLAILSRGPRLYSTRRLVEEARKRDCDVAVLDPLQFSLMIADDGVQILHKGERFIHDAVLPRIGHSITRHGVALIRQFEQLGIYTSNSSSGIIQSRDKLRASQILAKNKISIPSTAYVRDLRDVEKAIDEVGGLPVVIKVTQGTQGEGVFLRHTLRESTHLVEALLLTKKAVLIQEYIAESHGKDIRVLVVGDKVVASMRRKSRGREFRSNYHLNGIIEKVDLPLEYEELAKRAARVLGLKVAGVDLLEGADGPIVLEVNSSPGLEGIEKASNVNVAAHIIEFMIEDHVFTDIDMAQVMRTQPGQGALSLHLRNHPRLIGCTIGAIFPRDTESIPVFALSRDKKLEWNPEPHTQLRFDDVMIFYGETRALRSALKKVTYSNLPRQNENMSQDTSTLI